MYELSVVGQISSAHYLLGYEGKCKELHGHNWKVEIVVINDNLDEIGMVADFNLLKSKLNEVLSELDHVCLNELEFFKKANPTTENISKYIFEKYKKEIEPVKVKKIRVWEADNSSVTYYP